LSAFGGWRRHTFCDLIHVSYNVWKIATTFVTTSCFTHKGIFTDAISIVAVNEEGIDCKVGTVGRDGALEWGMARVHFADWGEAILGEGDCVGRFAATFVVGGGVSHEGGETGAFAVFAEDPVNVEGEVATVFSFGAFRGNASWEFGLGVNDDSVGSFAAALVSGGCGAREGFKTFACSVEALDVGRIHGKQSAIFIFDAGIRRGADGDAARVEDFVRSFTAAFV
jgi:hypothetical protein